MERKTVELEAGESFLSRSGVFVTLFWRTPEGGRSGNRGTKHDRIPIARIETGGLDTLALRMKQTLEAISMLGGNLPDERLTAPTGPRDAQYRGQMYVDARSMARALLAELESSDPQGAGKERPETWMLHAADDIERYRCACESGGQGCVPETFAEIISRHAPKPVGGGVVEADAYDPSFEHEGTSYSIPATFAMLARYRRALKAMVERFNQFDPGDADGVSDCPELVEARKVLEGGSDEVGGVPNECPECGEIDIPSLMSEREINLRRLDALRCALSTIVLEPRAGVAYQEIAKSALAGDDATVGGN